MTTPKLVLPELSVSQASKEITHNQALAILDQLTQARVLDKDLATPPGSPANGDAYIVAASPTGAWVGKTGQIAYWLTAVNAWSFSVPLNGWLVYVNDENKHYRRESGVWVELATGGSGATLPVVQALSSTRNLALADNNTFNVNSTTNNYTVTILPQASVAWAADTEIHFLPSNTGDITITGGVGVSVNGVTAGSVTLSTQNGAASIKRIASDSWWIGGVTGTTAEQRTALGLGSGDSPTFTALTLSNGQIVFPSTQVPSANANTLDDYEEGTWTPVLTFATPGNLSVVYSEQSAAYTKIGNRVIVEYNISTSTFTHTTASGDLHVTGLPFSATAVSVGALQYQNITKAGYTSFLSRFTTSSSVARVAAAGSGSTSAFVQAADLPSGGSVVLRGHGGYQ